MLLEELDLEQVMDAGWSVIGLADLGLADLELVPMRMKGTYVPLLQDKRKSAIFLNP